MMSAPALEGLDEGVDRRDHQVHVEDALGVRAQRRHHVGAKGDVGHEVPVHHVDVDVVGAGLGHPAHLLAQTGKVGGENGGSDPDGLLHGRREPRLVGDRKVAQRAESRR
jgi:hypothetical protein